MFKRIVLFVVTNLAVLAVLTVLLRVLGLERIPLGPGGSIPYQTLLAGAAVMGFAGSFISLLLSKTMAKWSTGAKVITEPRTMEERWLVTTVQRQADRLGIRAPEVAVYDSPEPNAFATGAFRNSALVAVSSGLLHAMKQDEVEAVLGHELAHVANGDMVTLTLIQGVTNTFVIFFSRVAGFLVDNFLSQRRDDDERSGPGIAYFVTSLVAQIVFGIAASMVVAWFSRRREFRADEGGASLQGKGAMIGALRRLQQLQEVPSALPQSVQAFGIRGGSSWMELFSSHPPLEKRIAALQTATPHL